MKKSLLALAALTAFAGAASAQSSVTLFGVVDLAVRSVDNDNGARTSVSHSGNTTSRLGFRGIEDLGGGLRAIFWIEGALQPDTGNSAGVNWTRRSTMALAGGWGEVRLGRDYTATFYNHTAFDPFNTTGVGNQLNLTNGARFVTQVRADNTISYFLPAMGGLYGQVQMGLDEGAASTGYIGGRLGYAAGPVNVAVAYGETKNEAVYGGNTMKAGNIGASFNMGFMTLMGQYHEYKVGSEKLTNMVLAGKVPLGNGNIAFSGAQTEYKVGTAKPKATQFALGYVYDLSKRTALYAQGSVIDNDKGLAFVATADGKSRGTDTGFTSTGYEFGIRHSF